MVKTIRIGFDDERVRSAVYGDLLNAGFTDYLIGAWKPQEIQLMHIRYRLTKTLQDIGRALAANEITIQDAVKLAQETARLLEASTHV